MPELYKRVEASDTRFLHAVTMRPNQALLGNCPDCGEDVTSLSKLIEYERTDGATGIYAECPACDAVITPE